jgi:WD40 repeat protein
MDPSKLSCAIGNITTAAEGQTVQYQINLRYGALSWEALRRFSAFDALLEQLRGQGYALLPSLPPKTILGAPLDRSGIEERRTLLKKLLYGLLSRPDTRVSGPLNTFLAIREHTEVAARSLLPQCERKFEDLRFGVSDMFVCPGLVIAAHEDATNLSRLGRVWTMVEPDELGAIHCYIRRGPDKPWTEIFGETFSCKVRAVCFEVESKQAFVGLEDGHVVVYQISKDGATETKRIQVHGNSPVTHLSCSTRVLLSLGFDQALRIVDTQSKEILTGGKLSKRLEGSEYLSTGQYEIDQKRAIVGTSKQQIFFFDVDSATPAYLHTIVVQPSGPVDQLVLSEDEQTLYVGHGLAISVYEMHPKRQESRIRLLMQFTSSALVDETGFRITAVAPSVEMQMLAAGFSNGDVAIWNLLGGDVLVGLHAHDGACTRVEWVGSMLHTAGEDGTVKVWNVSDSPDDYLTWQPTDEEDETVVHRSAEAVPEERPMSTVGGGTSNFALAGEESDDSNDDLVGAFK